MASSAVVAGLVAAVAAAPSSAVKPAKGDYSGCNKNACLYFTVKKPDTIKRFVIFYGDCSTRIKVPTLDVKDGEVDFKGEAVPSGGGSTKAEVSGKFVAKDKAKFEVKADACVKKLSFTADMG